MRILICVLFYTNRMDRMCDAAKLLYDGRPLKYIIRCADIHWVCLSNYQNNKIYYNFKSCSFNNFVTSNGFDKNILVVLLGKNKLCCCILVDVLIYCVVVS